MSGYPTIKFFPKDDKSGKAYEGGRDPAAFVEFLNQKAGTKRSVSGGLLPEAGRIAALDAIVAEYKTLKADAASFASKLKEIAEGVEASAKA